jgi:hypothetical protein
LRVALPYLAKSGLVPNIIGNHGIGKSSVIRQFASENGYSFHPYFLSQLSDMGDILGLPEFDRDSTGKALSTSFIHPKKLPRKPKSLLFFDELNRAHKDILQGIFQLALEGELHDYKLPEDSIIIMAMNPATEEYSVLDFGDKAFNDRFVHIKLDPTVSEFTSFMDGKYGKNDISEFVMENTKLLEEELSSFNLDFVKPSRRSWDRLLTLENTGVPDDLMRELGFGIVGTEAMIAYASYKANKIRIVSADSILNDFDKVRPLVTKYFEGDTLRSDIISTVNENLMAELNKIVENGAVTQKQNDNLVNYLLTIPKELAYSFLFMFKSNIKVTEDELLHKGLCSNTTVISIVNEVRSAKKAMKVDQVKETEKTDVPF